MKSFLRILELILAIILVFCGIYKIINNLSPIFSKKTDTEIMAVSMNEVISDSNDVEFSVTDVEIKNVIDEGEYWEVSTEGNFVIPKIEICNNGDEAYDVKPLNFVILSDGKEYEYCSNAWLAGEQEYGDNYMNLDTVNPGIKKEYYLAFEIPKDLDVSNCKLKIMDNAFVNREDVYIELKQ